MKNIHVLPTDKPNKLFKNKTNNNLGIADFRIHPDWKPQHIYITSDEEIKEGDCSFYPPFGVGKNIVINGELCFHIKTKNSKGSFTQRTYQTLDRNKKIILTTDQDLIKDGVQAIDDKFLEWFVKNPIEYVEVKSEILYKHKDTYRSYPSKCVNFTKTKINYYLSLIPKEESKQETLEEFALEQSLKIYGDYDTEGIQSNARAFIKIGAKWQQERSYTEEEVLKILNNYRNHFELYRNLQVLPNMFFEWFEQFKKK